jgi:hypothetical protein
LFIFWDVNDTDVANRMVKELLPRLHDRPVLACMHDVSHFTGRPRRYRWREYESLYQDLEIAGKFIDRLGWAAGVPDSRDIFGHYRNAGHWLIFESAASMCHNAEQFKNDGNE